MNPAGKAEGKAGALRRFSALWLVLPAAGVLAVVSRSSPFYAVNNWSDAQCFFLMGKAMAQGRMLYVDAVDQKGPLLFLLHCIANWVEADGFLGVWLIEIAAAALFLHFARRLFLLCGAGRAAALAPALVLAVSYSTIAFQKGDSAEELCLPLLLGGMVLGLETLRLRRPLTLRLGLALGLLCGGAFWIKYNLCAPFAAVAAVLLAWGLARRDWKGLCRAFAGGVLGLAAMSLPWLFYFWAGGALDEMLYNYFYCNLFLYSDSADAAPAQILANMWRNTCSDLRLNWVFGVFVALGLLWFTFAPRARGEKRDAAFWLQRLLLPLGFLAVTAAIYGTPNNVPIYYALALALFVPFGFVPLLAAVRAVGDKLAGDGRAGRRLWAALAAAALAAGVGFAWWHAPNRQAFGQRREDAVQYQFAQVMRSVPDASYEMWGVLDRGFGMAADLLQASPYIGSFNLPVEQIQQEFYGEPAFDTEFIVCGSYEDEYEASLARWEPLLEQHGYARVGEGQERQLNRTTYYTVRYLLYQRQE
ncbi:hypothetical protein [Candidatus Allofournierella excrementigallinarum]|uniref:hypothetical protein n=1 Tax=Candidatus Allofournierella excrementigallinarum TaxID=2838592 RepID=UPI00374EE4BD